jgi:exportin-2 (importin alpha re-exporter)
MQANAETLGALSSYLSQSLSPDPPTRRAAEESLRQAEGQPGFLQIVLALVKEDGAEMVVRQSAGVYFKNVVKRLWSGEEVIILSSYFLVDACG